MCNIQARYYERQNLCAAFLWNNESHEKKTIKFKGREFTLPPKSISILPDCKTVVFNTDSVSADYSNCKEKCIQKDEKTCSFNFSISNPFLNRTMENRKNNFRTNLFPRLNTT